MRNETESDASSRLLFLLLLMLPVFVLFLIPGGGLVHGGFWFWIAVLLSWALIWGIIGLPLKPIEEIEEEHEMRMLGGPSSQPPFAR